MEAFLDNPVFVALGTGNADKAFGSNDVKFFDVEVSPFAGFSRTYADGFQELHSLLPPGRSILFADRNELQTPKGWVLAERARGLQLLYPSKGLLEIIEDEIISLEKRHASQMVELASLTKPGPFNVRTIEFGNYRGIFDNGKLVAMAGRRLQGNDHIEISAVCTNPAYSGKGFAQKLILQQINSILGEGKIPFLHVRASNERAITLYRRLGFVENGDMYFHLMKRDQ